ncbi:MAG: glycerophosphodiester phosphodiesterase family protein [Armatimonadota bacterium]|nr:glycerophosphodiester phosphodiesterase family protein [Armatimonadota bacterium]MDR7421711.1 glycerophosphodiester phosphodiesterase family protein [Armatimonadota bacterium]MDR7454564.1 glycerophosphodiester phosphodiesterase family protein [Armatimonadota bacterium]MDR7457849.1 glycerophosphodiester phosphodiesterase family protein [Armatimonadota bacterium]MDR7495817.1 glycerophosphodiester phosphodiesterase family protein [Armatimonadota bacterium]
MSGTGVGDRRLAVIAHRGASGDAPENTLAAFGRARELGADGVELDVHLSADGEPVVIHDHRLERTTDGRGLVGEQPLAVLRRLDAGRWFGEAFAGQRIPTLDEALATLAGLRVIVELKNGPIYYPRIAARVAAVVRASGHGRVTVSSFDHPALRDVRQAAPELNTAVLFAARPVDPVRLAWDAGAVLLHPQWAFATADLVAAAHAAGLRVEAWTVDEPDWLRRVMAAGVDGIMTNYPARLLALLRETTGQV